MSKREGSKKKKKAIELGIISLKYAERERREEIKIQITSINQIQVP